MNSFTLLFHFLKTTLVMHSINKSLFLVTSAFVLCHTHVVNVDELNSSCSNMAFNVLGYVRITCTDILWWYSGTGF